MIDFSKIEFKETSSVQDFATRIRGGIVLSAEVSIQDIQRSREIDVRRFAREEVLRILHHKVYGELRRPLAELIDIAVRSNHFEEAQRAAKLSSEIWGLLDAPK